MVTGKKVLMSMFVVMMVMCLCVSCSYSQDKPSEELMKSLIIKQYDPDRKKQYTISKFNITNSFFSKENGSFCIEVDWTLDKRRGGGMGVEEGTDKWSFEKKGNKWYLGKWK